MVPEPPYDDSPFELLSEQQLGELIASALDSIYAGEARSFYYSCLTGGGLLMFELRSSQIGWRLHIFS